MLGKQKCKILKQIRQRIADENDIPYVTRECTFQGACKGTCPKCEAELRYLEQQLQKRQSLGKRVAVAALCTGMAFSTVGCSGPLDRLEELMEDHSPTNGGLLKGLAAFFTSPTPEPTITDGEVSWPDEPLEGEPTVEPGEVDVLEGEEAPELAGDVEYFPDPCPTDSGNG